MTVWTTNAAAFATTRCIATDMERNSSVHRALTHISAGDPAAALAVLLRSLDRQTRLAGINPDRSAA